jgi:hypothetical protein
VLEVVRAKVHVWCDLLLLLLLLLLLFTVFLHILSLF